VERGGRERGRGRRHISVDINSTALIGFRKGGEKEKEGRKGDLVKCLCFWSVLPPAKASERRGKGGGGGPLQFLQLSFQNAVVRTGEGERKNNDSYLHFLYYCIPFGHEPDEEGEGGEGGEKGASPPAPNAISFFPGVGKEG